MILASSDQQNKKSVFKMIVVLKFKVVFSFGVSLYISDSETNQNPQRLYTNIEEDFYVCWHLSITEL